VLKDAFKTVPASGAVAASNRSQLLLLHLLVTIVLSYQILFSKGTLFTFDVSSLVCLGLLTLTAVLVLLPSSVWETTRFVGGLVLTDTLITSGAIYYSGVSDSGLYITFFLIVLLSASTPSLKQAIAFAIVPCIGYAVVLVSEVQDFHRLNEGDLLRIPILLILATFYGAAAETGRRLHQRAERILIESEVKFRSVVETAHEAIVLTDGSGSIISWNKAAQTMFGYQPSDVLGKSLKTLVPERFRTMWGLEWFHEQGGGELIGSTIEFVGVRSDGTEFPSELSLATWETEEGTFFSAIIRDISERKRMEDWVYRKQEQLRQAQKMEAIGRLASQVAHDFNHVLFVIMSCSQLLLRRLPAEDASRGKIDEIQKAADRGQALTQQLLNYGRKQPRKPGKVNVNSIVTDLIPMLERLVGNAIAIRTELTPSAALVMADVSQFEQVIVNLVTNARDAMPDRGTVTIQTRIVGLAESELPIEVPTGRAVVVSVSDTGAGMDAETKSRCLEPFFTTKSIGQGTGLGLATVSDIIQQSGGRIDIESVLGQGTTVNLHLPLMQVDALTVAALSEQPAPRDQKRLRTILVVDDDGHARRAMFEILRHDGYRVLEGASGSHALSLAASQSEPIDLLLTDVVMPEMNGQDLAARLKQMLPAMKVIYVSGYNPDFASNYGMQSSGNVLLQKPFTPETLSSRVRAALDAR